MEDVIIAVVRDLPSTAVLILFVWATNRQYQNAMELLSNHMNHINEILQSCIEGQQLTERGEELRELEKILNRKLEHLTKLVDRFIEKAEDK